ncbi:THUMP domain-containing 1 [Olea europaea subsp. europaea]|uniref:THUMP domain-containing 1 n=1 Tax=Olea europaea subsp. europaea TaxID=158383 RepID=A0A8S0S5N6_OLEEU|nr:THUMP domain-containing 1 [Olea europaea subsp. europaea]
MATENKSKPNNPNKTDKKRKQYLPHNRPVKKGKYALCPGVQGFFITCDGGREHQASNEAINVIDSFYEDLVNGTETTSEQAELSKKPLNKVIKFTYSDSSSSDDDDNDDHHEDESNVRPKEEENKHAIATGTDVNNENLIKEESGHQKEDGISSEKQAHENKEKTDDQEVIAIESAAAKKQRTENDASKCRDLSNKLEKKSVDRLIEDELAELGDRSKRRFSSLDSGCNGVVFVQMRKRDGDPCPKDIVQHMMTSLASTRKHVSRFLLRVLPIEMTCYASDEEIRRAIKPVIEQFFPIETQNPLKFAVLYDARANTGVDRTKIIDAVAKSVPSAHKVDLSNPDVSIVVQIVKTICLIGIVEKYKELAKYNVRELTSSK